MNLYEILEVDKSASLDDIKSSYRRLAKIHHPDKNQDGNDDMFKKINQAYKILSDEKCRQKYDRTGQINDQPQSNFSSNFSDLFSSMFNPFQQKAKSSAPSKGNPLHCKVKLSIEQLVFGCERKFQIDRMDWCSCEEHCENCKGQGVIKQVVHVGPLQMIQNMTCGFCQASGKRPNNSCEKCKGVGKIKFVKIVTINIPPRSRPDYNMVIEGLGEPGNKRGDKPGDLCVSLEIEPNSKYKIIENKHIKLKEKISLVDSICGKTVTIDVFDQTEIIDTRQIGIIPEGYLHVIKNKGLENGDFMVEFNIEWPERKPFTNCQLQQREQVRSYFDSGVTPQ